MISRNSFNGAFPIKRLGDVVEFLDSQRRPVAESERRAGPYPYFGANGQQGTIDDFIFDEPLVLLAEDGGHFDEPDRGIAYRISGKTWVNNHAHVLRPKSTIDISYLSRVLENYNVKPFVTGTTRGKLTKAGASEILIPVPLLAEQRRIADILDRAETLRIKRRTALAQLDSLTQSIFLELFDNPVANVKGWRKVQLQQVCDNITDGTHDTPPRVQAGVPFITSKNIRPFEFDLSDLDFVSSETHQQIIKRCNPRSGDVLYTNIGVNVGNAVANRLSFEFSLKNVALIQPDFKKLDSIFLESLLNFGPFKETILMVSSIGGAQKFISLRVLRNVAIVLPPIVLQREFARQAKAVETLKATQFTSLVELDALFASLQHRAFRGEL
jgi:type I restriction enzyme S subunit